MSTPQAPRLSPIAQEAAEWLRLFRRGVFEDNFLDVSRLDAGAWESARDELAEAALLTVEWNVLLAGRPYLRFPETKAPAPPGLRTTAPGTGRAGAILTAARARHVEAYRALSVAVRQALHGPNPQKGMEIMALEEANLRLAVGLARDLGDTAKAAEMGDVFTRYLDRAGRADDRARWVAWLAGEGPGEEEAKGAPEPPAAAPEPAEAAIEPPAPAPEPPVAAPEVEAVQVQETEGARLQREGAAAVAEGQIARAVELYQQALRWFQDARDTAGVADTCALFGLMEEAAGRPDAARTWHERAAAMRGG